jgi:hypothetical protein
VLPARVSARRVLPAVIRPARTLVLGSTSVLIHAAAIPDNLTGGSWVCFRVRGWLDSTAKPASFLGAAPHEPPSAFPRVLYFSGVHLIPSAVPRSEVQARQG